MAASVVLTSLGSAVSALGKIGEYLAAPIGRQFTYMCCFNSNIKELETQSKELETTRQGVQMGVEDTRRKARVVGPTVQAWLNKANDVTRDVEEIIVDKAKVSEGCLNGWCPNLKLRYSLSRKAVKTTKVVVDLQAAGFPLTKSSYSPPSVCVEVIPNKDYTEFESRKLNMEEIIMALMHDEINLIGICGLPGVGKTKMVQEVRKRAAEEKLFDEVVFVVVSQNPDLANLQKCIGESLGVANMGKFDHVSTRAGLLNKRLLQDNKKILLIFDDVWEEFDLHGMGIPLGGSNKNLKMLYTSRNQRLWHNVQTKKEISLGLLSKDEAWKLFKQKAGNLVDTPNLQPIAKQIVDECGRLPLALVLIGSTLSKKSGGNATKNLWEEMLDRLSCPSGTPAHERLFLSVKASYNYVEDEEAKRLFLLCCFFEEDQCISVEDLARYGLGLSLFHGINEMRKVRRRVIALVDDLMSCYLLLDTGFDGHVKLHDVVRDMGIFIASRDGGSLVSHGNMSEWPKEDTYEDYTSTLVISQERIEFREGLRCPNLQFLFLRCNNFDEMQCNFFDRIKMLKVLALIPYSLNMPLDFKSSVQPIRRNCSLALQSLRYLRTLCLENLNATFDNVSAIGDLEDLEILSFGGCLIGELPTEIGKLAKLRLLDLTQCRLRRIPPGVISRLVGLEELYLIDCGFVDWEGEGNEQGISASLREFESLSKLNTLEVSIRIIDAAMWPKIPIFSKLTNFLIEIEIPLSCVYWRFRRPKANKLSINSSTPIRSDYGGLNSLLRRTECLALQGIGTSDLVRELFVEGPEGLQLLKDLLIGLCDTPECLANTMNPPAQLNTTTPAVLPVLETLHLYELTNLREICHGPVRASSFGKLISLTIKACVALEEVIRNDRGEDAHMTTRTIEFPKLESLVLRELPSLVGFCSGVDKIHFPELKELSVRDVGSLSLFPPEVSLPNLEKLELINLQNLETLGQSPLSFGSLSKLKHIYVRHCGKLHCIFPSQLLPILRDPEKLTVELEGVDASEPNTDILSPADITLCYLPKLNYISKRDPVVFKYIHSLHIFECDSLRYVFAPTMTKSIPQLRQLSISGCKVLSRIVAEENGLGESSVDEIEFPQLVRLVLQNLPNLVSFFPKVTTNPQPLFNGKVAIPSLKYLEIYQLKNLSDLGFNELPTSSFSELTLLAVTDCENLGNTFHPSMVEALVNLEKLVIRNCSKMEAVVDSEEKGHMVTKMIEFPKLKILELRGLPCLVGFCKGIDKIHFPELKWLLADDVGCLSLFAQEVSLPNLEGLRLINLWNLETLGHGPLSFGSLSKLKQMYVRHCGQLLCVFPLKLFPMLRDPEKLTVELEGVDASEPNTDILSPAAITLCFLPKLNYISKRDPVVFKYIHSLHIFECDSLRYVFAPTMAKSIPQLRLLSISSCKVLSRIVAEENGLGESSVDEIEFPQLETLILQNLPSLVSFFPKVTTNPQPLFNGKVAIPSLKYLEIYQLKNLSDLGFNELPTSSLSELKVFAVKDCENLGNSFHPSMVEALVNLEKLVIRKCSKMEAVVNLEKKGHTVTKMIEFPKLKVLELGELPSIVGFCKGVEKIHFPELMSLLVEDVCFLSLFPQEVLLPNLEGINLINLWNLETLGPGPLSFGSLSKLKQMCVSDLPPLLCVFPSEPSLMLQHLEKLSSELEWEDASEPNTDILSPAHITLCYLLKLNYISKRDPVVFKYIHSLHIFECDSLRYVFAPTMAKSIPQLRELKIAGCRVLSRIVAEENGLGESSVDEIEFPQLETLILQNLPSLVSFFPKVTTNPQPLFNGKVAIPSLKYLEIYQLKNLSDLGFNELPTSSLSELKVLSVIDCENLENTFHPSMVEVLVNLEKLVIRNCSKMEVVVDSEEKRQGRDMDKVMFPQLREMELDSLPNLRMFCHFTYHLEFPLLSRMDIRGCSSLDASSLGHLSFPNLCLPGTSLKDIPNHPRRVVEEEDLLEEEGAGRDIVGERKESSGIVEEGARGDESERIKRIKGKGVLEVWESTASFTSSDDEEEL